jgi:peptidoglycan/xylan/chitin deacetylase (PgdA/CDA1 family)
MRKPGLVLITALVSVLFVARWAVAELPASEAARVPTALLTSTPSLAVRPAATPTPSLVPAEEVEAHITTPTETEAQVATSTPSPTAVPAVLTKQTDEHAHLTETSRGAPAVDIPTYPPNQLGDVLVLVYHGIGRPEARWVRTPENLRADLEYMLAHGYYPINLIDLARGDLSQVPKGRRPIVLTFDDSTAGHFRYLEDGTIDPDCAVGILKAMHDAHGDNWPLRATFFVLLNAGKPGPILFRQAGLGPQKVQALVDWGMEVGSHTITHADLSQIGPGEIQWELAVSQDRIEALVPGYHVRSLALPYGIYPADISLLKEGYAPSEELTYRYEAVVTLRAKPALSPFSAEFDPLFIPRVQAIQSQLDTWFSYYERYPERYYVSAGDEEEKVSLRLQELIGED